MFGTRHLRLTAYSCYYNEMRTHLPLDKDAPLGRAVQRYGVIVVIGRNGPGCYARRQEDYFLYRCRCNKWVCQTKERARNVGSIFSARVFAQGIHDRVIML
jgi:hypothetical protein